MKVAEIMTTSIVSVSPETPLDEAMRTMEENRIRHLPVTEGERVVGVISDRDVLDETGWLPARVRDAYDPGSRNRVVGDVMHHPAVTVSSTAGVLTACLDLLGRSIGCLPVVENGRLVGVVSEMDVLALYVRQCGGDAIDVAVGEKMTRNPVSVPESTALGAAAERMISLGVRHLPVVEEGRLVGFVSDRDLHRAAGSGRSTETPVEEVMTRDVLGLDAGERLSRAAEVMAKHRISALPVVADDVIEGVVTLTDVLDHCLVALRDPDPLEKPS